MTQPSPSPPQLNRTRTPEVPLIQMNIPIRYFFPELMDERPSTSARLPLYRAGVNDIVALSPDEHASEMDKNNRAVDYSERARHVLTPGGSSAVTRMRTDAANAARSPQLQTSK